MSFKIEKLRKFKQIVAKADKFAIIRSNNSLELNEISSQGLKT